MPRYHRATVPQYPSATVPQCHGAAGPVAASILGKKACSTHQAFCAQDDDFVTFFLAHVLPTTESRRVDVIEDLLPELEEITF